MKKEKVDIWQMEEIAKVLDSSNYEEIYYDRTGIADYKKKPYSFFIFLRKFGVRKVKSNKGRWAFYMTIEPTEVVGKTYKEIGEKLEEIVSKCEDEAPYEAERDWMPKKWVEVKRAVKEHNKCI